MTTTTTPSTTGYAGLGPMARIEALRLARHPVFLLGVVLAFAVSAWLYLANDDPGMNDLLAMPVIPAFFIGLTSLVATARLTRSTESSMEAMGTAPGTEARRTAALAIACLVPFAAGVVWTMFLLLMAWDLPPAPQEWWFATMPDWQVWSILVALGPVACLGGALLGVLTGRWVKFPGAAAVVVVALVAVDLVGQMAVVEGGTSELRLWVPWAMFHSGTDSDGTAILAAGNPLGYLGYLLCLCAAAALAAMWHDRTARTRQLRVTFAGVVVVGLACLALAMTTGNSENRTSDPVPVQGREVTLRWWYLRRAVPWRAVLLPCLGAALLAGGLARWPSTALAFLPALLACCAAAAAFAFDERSVALVAVTPRGAAWRRTARLAVAVVPLGVWSAVVLLRPGSLPLERPGWALIGAAAIVLVVGVAALASRREVPAPGGTLAALIALGALAPLVVSLVLGWPSVYPVVGFDGGIAAFWLVVGGAGAAALAVALRPGIRA